MDTTVPTQVDNQSGRRKRHSSAQVVLSVEEMVGLGYNRREAGEALGMDPRPRGSLYVALRRRGRLDLWRSLDRSKPKPKPQPARSRPFDPAMQIACAAEMLRRLPQEDVDIVEQRRLELDAEMNDEPLDIAPTRRQVRGPGGIVRWVAA